MLKSDVLLKVFSFTLIILFALNLKAQPCKEIIGYYPNWQWYDRNKLVKPQSIDYSKYTIINYCFFSPQPDGTINLTDAWADENLLLGQPNWSSGGYYPNTSIVDLAHNNGVKILPSIGGWTLSNNFPTIAADPAKRATFIQSCINLINTYNFDGIDIDWEYPGFAEHEGTAGDKANFNLLLQELRTSLTSYTAVYGKPMILTACVGAASEKMENVDWPVVSELLDAINLMSYDFFGTWDGVANHNSPLFAPANGDPSFNLAAAVEKLINFYGVNPQKINAGIAFYGRSQKTNTSPALFGQTNGQADIITFSADEGTPLYYNTLLNKSLFDEYWDDNAKVPYLLGKNGLNTFLSYDNEQSVGLKAEYIVEKNLRGAIIWEITGDYIESSPGSGIISGTPLADTLNNVFCNYNPNTVNNPINNEYMNNTDVLIYPNPTKESITIKSDDPLISVEIISSAGLVLEKHQPYKNTQIINLNRYNKGFYIIKTSSINRTNIYKINKE